MESESLFNDGVAAVLFGLALAWTRHAGGSLAEAGESLLAISGGGIALGMLTGALGLASPDAPANTWSRRP